MLLSATDRGETAAGRRGAEMAKDQNDRLIRAFARLQALKKNIPNGHLVDGFYVQEYHEILKHLEEERFDIVEFKVPDRHMQVATMIFRSGRAVERSVLLSKLDAVLAYFELVTQKPATQIGFKPPTT